VERSPTFDLEAMAQAERVARSCDVFYNQGKAVPWFAIVQGALDIPPSTFFARVADHLEANPSRDVLTLQQDFLTGIFADARPEMGTVAADLATYFSGAAELAEAARLEEGPGPVPGHPRLSPLARLASFHHDPGSLLENLFSGITELEDLSYVLPPQPTEAILFWQEGETVIRNLTAPQARALGQLDPGPAQGQALDPCLASLIPEGILLG
jgi:hypothetical protein